MQSARSLTLAQTTSCRGMYVKVWGHLLRRLLFVDANCERLLLTAASVITLILKFQNVARVCAIAVKMMSYKNNNSTIIISSTVDADAIA